MAKGKEVTTEAGTASSYKAVFIVGYDFNLPNRIVNLYKQAGYLIIGDGRTKLSELDLDQLTGKIDQNTRIDIQAHGTNDEGRHYIEGMLTKDFLRKLVEYSGNKPLNIYLHSCYSGAAAPDVVVLPEGSVLVPGGELLETLVEVTNSVISQASKDLSITDPVRQFATEFLLNATQNGGMAIKQGDRVFKYKLRPPARLLFNPDDIIRYYTAERERFVTEYNQFCPAKTLGKLPELTEEEALTWKEHHLNYTLSLPINDSRKLASIALKHLDRVGVCQKLRVNLALELTNKQIVDAKCFDFSTVSTAVEYLYQAYARSDNLEARKMKVIEVFNRIYGLDTSSKVRAVMEYDLDPTEVQDAECFDNSYGADGPAFLHLKAAYDRDVDPAAKKRNAQVAFNQIKDLKSSGQVRAVLEYGLDPKDVKAAKCFDHPYDKDDPTGQDDQAILHIQAAYDRDVDPVARTRNVQEALHQIKELNADQVSAFRKFHIPLELVRSSKSLTAGFSAIEYIRDACNQPSSVGKEGNARIALAVIELTERVINILDTAKAFDWGTISWRQTIPIAKAIYDKVFWAGISVTKVKVIEKLREYLWEALSKNPQIVSLAAPLDEELAASLQLRKVDQAPENEQREAQIKDAIGKSVDTTIKWAEMNQGARARLEKQYFYVSPIDRVRGEIAMRSGSVISR